MPSLPTCMSQKSALPSARAASSSLTKSPRFDGLGTATARKSPGKLMRSVSKGGFRTRAIVISDDALPGTTMHVLETAAKTHVKQMRAKRRSRLLKLRNTEEGFSLSMIDLREVARSQS